MYVKNWPDTRFRKYEEQIEALGPLNDAQLTYHLDTPDDDPTLTEEDVIPMCEMLEVKVDLRRSNILYTAERDWAKPLAEAKGMQYDEMSKEELVEMNEEIRRVLTIYERGMETYERKVDMTKHNEKLDKYNSRAIAYYLEHRRCQRMVAGIAKLGDLNEGSTSNSQAEAMDQEIDFIDNDFQDSTDGKESSDNDGGLNDDSSGSFKTVIASGHQQSEKRHQENPIHDISFDIDSEENPFDIEHEDSTDGNESSDDDGGLNDNLAGSFEAVIASGRQQSQDQHQENAIHGISFEINSEENPFDDDHEELVIDVDDNPVDADKENVTTNIGSLGADRFIELATRSTTIPTKDETSTQTNSEPKWSFEYEDEEVAGFNPKVESEDIQLNNPDGIVARYERPDNSTGNNSQTYTQLFGGDNYDTSTQQ